MLTPNRTYFVPTCFPQGDFRWARNGAIDAIKSAAVLSLYSLASACCGAVETFRLQLQSCLSLRASAHTGVAIRIPLWYALLICKTFWRTDCHTPRALPLGAPSDIGHWFAMTVEKPTLRNHPTTNFAKRRLFFECQRFRRTSSSTIESGGNSACKSVSALHEGSVCFWRSLKKLKLTARRRTGLNRVNCTWANT